MSGIGVPTKPDEEGSVYVPETWVAGHSGATKARPVRGMTVTALICLLSVSLGIAAWVAYRHPHRTSTGVAGRIVLGGDIAQLATGFGSVWAADKPQGRIVRVDARHHAVVARINAPYVSSISAGLGAVWANAGGILLKIDPRTNTAVRRVPVFTPDGVPYETFDVVPSRHAIWLVGPDVTQRLDPRTLAVRGFVPLSHDGVWPIAWTPTRAGLWVLSADGKLRLYDWRTGRQADAIWSPVPEPSAIVASGDALAVLSSNGDVARVDPRTGRALWRTQLPLRVGASGAARGLLFVKGADPARPRDLMVEISLSDGRLVSKLSTTEFGSAGGIAAIGDDAWMAAPGGKLIATAIARRP
jgi:hypothetical protein